MSWRPRARVPACLLALLLARLRGPRRPHAGSAQRARRGQPREALAAAQRAARGRQRRRSVPSTIEGDHVLFLLDRSIVLQQLDQYDAIEPRPRARRQADRGARLLARRLDDIAQVPVLGRRGPVQGAGVREAADQHHEHGELPRARRPQRRARRGAALRRDAEVHLRARVARQVAVGAGQLPARASSSRRAASRARRCATTTRRCSTARSSRSPSPVRRLLAARRLSARRACSALLENAPAPTPRPTPTTARCW